MTGSEAVAGRFWPTRKALRALAMPLPLFTAQQRRALDDAGLRVLYVPADIVLGAKCA